MNQTFASDGSPTQLLAIVEVAHDQRVRCGNPGCGHSVFKAIHVVQDGTALLVLGSTCFDKRYGRGALGTPRYGGGTGRTLTVEERELLLSNTAGLLERFEAEREQQRQKLHEMKTVFEARQAAVQVREAWQLPKSSSNHLWTLGRQSVSRATAKRGAPWAWMKPMTSMAGFRLRDGSGWVRVQHRDGQQMLTCWPSFDGWDEWLPAYLGTPVVELEAYRVHDVQALIAYLRAHSTREKVSGLWSEIEATLKGAVG